MKRRESTPLTQGESRAMSKNRAAIEATTEEDWQALERFYAAPQEKTYARKDLAALLNNWNGEIDRAKAWLGQAPAGTPVTALPPIPAPPNFREFMAKEYPNFNAYPIGQNAANCQWEKLPRTIQQMVAEDMRKGGQL